MQISFVSLTKTYMQPGTIPIHVGDILTFNGQPKNNLTIFRNQEIVRTTTTTLLSLQGMVTNGLLAIPDGEKDKAAAAIAALPPKTHPLTPPLSAHNLNPTTVRVPVDATKVLIAPMKGVIGVDLSTTSEVALAAVPAAAAPEVKPEDKAAAGTIENVQELTKKITDEVVIEPVQPVVPTPEEVKPETTETMNIEAEKIETEQKIETTATEEVKEPAATEPAPEETQTTTSTEEATEATEPAVTTEATATSVTESTTEAPATTGKTTGSKKSGSKKN